MLAVCPVGEEFVWGLREQGMLAMCPGCVGGVPGGALSVPGGTTLNEATRRSPLQTGGRCKKNNLFEAKCTLLKATTVMAVCLKLRNLLCTSAWPHEKTYAARPLAVSGSSGREDPVAVRAQTSCVM